MFSCLCSLPAILYKTLPVVKNKLAQLLNNITVKTPLLFNHLLCHCIIQCALLICSNTGHESRVSTVTHLLKPSPSGLQTPRPEPKSPNSKSACNTGDGEEGLTAVQPQ